MTIETKINMDTFKIVTRAIAFSSDLEVMANQLALLLTGALEVKACAILVFDHETRSLGRLASYGLSPRYLKKGPLLADKSTAENLDGESVIVRDVQNDNRIQYPAQAKEEGIASMVSIPIVVSENVLGALRLYHPEIWEVSDQDLDSLRLLAVIIGLAMVHVSTVGTINTIDELIHTGFTGNVLRQ
ncbi:GAF domain protein [delta proteobacterium NaphS2]|nr:GAF domain protein [delta proteobacterium NaphS2]